MSSLAHELSDKVSEHSVQIAEHIIKYESIWIEAMIKNDDINGIRFLDETLGLNLNCLHSNTTNTDKPWKVAAKYGSFHVFQYMLSRFRNEIEFKDLIYSFCEAIQESWKSGKVNKPPKREKFVDIEFVQRQ